MTWLWITGFVLVGVAIIAGLLWWRVWHRKRALRLLLKQAQQVTDTQVQAALQTLGVSLPTGSTQVADVWGHGIMAFAYALPTQSATKGQVEAALAAQTQLAGLTASDARYPLFTVTDWWTRDGETHLDVAYVTNAATREYVADVAKVS